MKVLTFTCRDGIEECKGVSDITGNFWHPILPFGSSQEELMLIGSIVQAYAGSAFWLTRMRNLCSSEPPKSFVRNKSLSEEFIEEIAVRVRKICELPDVTGNMVISGHKEIIARSMTTVSSNWKDFKEIRDLLAHGVFHQQEGGRFYISRCPHYGISLDIDTLTTESNRANDFLKACSDVIWNYSIISPLLQWVDLDETATST